MKKQDKAGREVVSWCGWTKDRVEILTNGTRKKVGALKTLCHFSNPKSVILFFLVF